MALIAHDEGRRHTRLTQRRLQAHLTILGVLLWAILAVDCATPSRLMRSGQVKGTDFVHFYTLARLAADGRAEDFADLEAQRAIQVSAVPESTKDWYPPVYGPLVAVVLAPLGWASYGTALTIWVILSGLAYFWIVGILVRRTSVLGSYRRAVFLAALASPAFWNLVIHGQLSVIGLAAVSGGYIALSARREILCGILFGVLAYKPSIFVPLLAILVLAGAWRILAGALISTALQAMLSVLAVGLGGLVDYGRIIADAPNLAVVLAAKPEQMHSWRAFWLLLLPRGPATILYMASAAASVVVAARVWRTVVSPELKVAALLIATILAAPHLYVYDLVLLTPAWIWLTDWYLSQPALTPRFGQLLYVGFLAPLLPVVTQVTHVQISVVAFALLMWLLWRSSDPRNATLTTVSR